MKRSLRRRLLASPANAATKSGRNDTWDPNWALSNLEPRLMLAGDAGAEVAAAAGTQSDATSGESESKTASGTTAQSTATEIAFVDSRVEDESQIETLARDGVEVVIIDDSSNPIDQMTAAIAQRSQVSTVHVFSHGESGRLEMGGQFIDAASLRGQSDVIRQWANQLTEKADILLYGCEAAAGDEGTALLHTLADLTGADVAGSDDLSGSQNRGGDWDLEVATGTIESNLIASVEVLRSVEMVLPITIRAAGATGQEQMRLQVNGTTVRTWNNIGGNAENNVFVEYNFNADELVDISDVQIRFTNDQYLNDGEFDSNLRVDRIVLDGMTYQTEAPDVFSTGTWKDGGITPGFKQEEWIHSNGYFQYGAAATNPGTLALQTSNVSVDEDAGNARINVIRTGGSDGTVMIDYDTFAGNASAGSDYTRRTGTLTFADGETSKATVIPIINDSQVETNETFNITIDNPTGGANLSVPRTATVSIIDNDVNLPNYNNFESVAGLDLNGDARRNGSVLELTTTNDNRAGSEFFNTPINLANDGSFRSSFSFQATGRRWQPS